MGSAREEIGMDVKGLDKPMVEHDGSLGTLNAWGTLGFPNVVTW